MKQLFGCATAVVGVLVAGVLATSAPSATAATRAVPAPNSIDNLNWLNHVQQRGHPPVADHSVRQREITVRAYDQEHPRGQH